MSLITSIFFPFFITFFFLQLISFITCHALFVFIFCTWTRIITMISYHSIIVIIRIRLRLFRNNSVFRITAVLNPARIAKAIVGAGMAAGMIFRVSAVMAGGSCRI